MFRIIQTEVGFINDILGNQNIVSCLSNLLFQKFHIDFKENKNLEKSIEAKIKELEEYNFLSRKSMYKEYKTIKDEYEEISFEKVKDMILTLRERRIKVYKTLLKDFKNNKDKYLEQFHLF